LILEVPDFTASLLNGDCSTLWEEHLVYFTGVTFAKTLQAFGLRLHCLETFAYTPEDSLVAVATAIPANSPNSVNSDSDAEQLNQEWARGREYSTKIAGIQRRWHDLLIAEGSMGRPVALLGAGHLGIMFLNLMDLAKVVQLIVDDDPEKVGKLLPGTLHRIQQHAVLDDRGVRLCLLSVSPEGEQRVLQRHHRFVEHGGRFRSIFPSSPIAYIPQVSQYF
jgi:hypothetical protein